MKFGVVIFPGSNCDKDIILAIKNTIGKEVVELWHKDTDLKNCDVIFLPGGFSYGDYLRSGAIAKFSPIMNGVIKFANNGGYLIGICNGFQILTESGLLPGALLHNTSNKFICKNVYLKVNNGNTLITNQYNGQAIKIPIVEIHLSNIHKREEFRKKSFISEVADGVIFGFGSYSYILAIMAINNLLTNKND